MAEIYNMHQAKTSLSRLVERARADEEVVIARNGEPLVKLVPVPRERKPRVPGRYKGKIWISPGCFEPAKTSWISGRNGTMKNRCDS
jgi:prevent-host-death family protein